MDVRSAGIAGVAGVIVVLGIAATALGGDPAGQGERIRVAYFPNVGHAIPIVGMERGIFADHLNDTVIETRVFDSGPQAIESIFADSIDLAYVGPGPAINGYLNSENGNLRILAGAASGGASLVVHPDSAGGAFDFGGKRIAAPQIGNTQDVSLRHHLSELGLAPTERGGTVTIHNIPNPDIHTLFVKGDLDAAWVAEPWATILEQELGGTRLFYEEDLWPGGRFASVLLVANTDYVEQNPETVRRWLQAHNLTAQQINADKGAAGTTLNGFLAGLLGRGLDERVARTSLSNIEITPDPLEGSVHTFAKRADDLGYLGRGGYDLSGIFYNAGPYHDPVEKEKG